MAKGSQARHGQSKYLTVNSEKVRMPAALLLPHSANCFAEWRWNGWMRPVFLGHHHLAEQRTEPGAGTAFWALETPSLGSSEQDQGGPAFQQHPQHCSRTGWVERRGGAIVPDVGLQSQGRKPGDGRGARTQRDEANSPTFPREHGVHTDGVLGATRGQIGALGPSCEGRLRTVSRPS